VSDALSLRSASPSEYRVAETHSRVQLYLIIEKEMQMRKLMFVVAALATLGGSAVTPAEAYMYHPGYHGIGFGGPFCRTHHCGHGPVRHRVCAAWEVFGGERHCVRWRYVW
jgi:hypothetical protein